MSRLYLNILSEAQKELWKQLEPVSQMGFTLYGGTALALQLNHRRSVDFDFFSSKPLQTQHILDALPNVGKLEIEKSEERTLELITQSGVHLSFFGELAIRRVGNPISVEENHLKIASLDDLMAAKLKVLFHRIECKDYMDLAEMLRHGMSLSKGLSDAVAIYGNMFQPIIALKSMTYFEGGDLADLPDRDKQTLVHAAQKVVSWEYQNPDAYEL
jgi:hypothetical protein